ncbi:methylated-DNA--[protein]-cysteine S-methyltransferase [Breoghania sp. JC706]|uniref:methylated-DNA--[protein]-cysteine S-methyltransferase n=1 Tax=Breoghania sp. JC706 TaxID=3117732 RepID=UPI0030095DDA
MGRGRLGWSANGLTRLRLPERAAGFGDAGSGDAGSGGSGSGGSGFGGSGFGGSAGSAPGTQPSTPSRQPMAAPPPDAPGFVMDALAKLKRYFAGEREDFTGVPLDLSGVSQSRRTLYAALCRIGWGETTTYGGLAEMLGTPGAAQAVGRAMGANPIPVIIPCHRVLAAGGRMGGFSAPGGVVTKQYLLALEGVEPEETRQMGFGF